jgi:Fuc2NAc and GlcNAc transferase
MYGILPNMSFFMGFVIWFSCLWSINLFNFMDGLDGLATMEALFFLIMAALFFALKGQYFLCQSSLCLSAVLLGFLLWNWPQARIFMGDSGSYFLGLVIAVFAWLGYFKANISLWIWGILYGVFITDATLTLCRRIWRRERIMRAHRQHAFQRLHQAGFSHVQVLGCVAMLNTLLAGIAITVYYYPALTLIGASIAILLLLGAYYWVERIRPYE